MAEDLHGRTEDTIIDGRILKKDEKIQELVDVIEESMNRTKQASTVNSIAEDRLVSEVRAVTEKMAKELIPEIAERVIREEIEKLKRKNDE
jgi:hypothetical protein